MEDNRKSAGQDYIYICLVCGNKEKEYAVHNRHSKHCGKCAGHSVKSTLLDTIMVFDK